MKKPLLMRWVAMAVALLITAVVLLIWGARISGLHCYAGVVASAICSSLVASLCKWWRQKTAATEQAQAVTLDPRGQQVWPYMRDMLASVQVRVIVLVMAVGLIGSLAVAQWQPVLLGALGAFCVLSLVPVSMQLLAVVARPDGGDEPPTEPEESGIGEPTNPSDTAL